MKNKALRICFVFLVTLLTVEGYAQPYGYIPLDLSSRDDVRVATRDSPGSWHKGVIKLETGDSIRGLIFYDLENGVVACKDSTRMETYTARKVPYFEIMDKGQRRQFCTMPYAYSEAHKGVIFFELLAEGKLSLFSRESIKYSISPDAKSFYSNTDEGVLVLSYFLTEKGDASVKPFNGNKHDLVRMMGDQGSKVEEYIKHNKLRLRMKNEFAQIIAYYNSL